jgi:hypothetical protein
VEDLTTSLAGARGRGWGGISARSNRSIRSFSLGKRESRVFKAAAGPGENDVRAVLQALTANTSARYTVVR